MISVDVSNDILGAPSCLNRMGSSDGDLPNNISSTVDSSQSAVVMIESPGEPMRRGEFTSNSEAGVRGVMHPIYVGRQGYRNCLGKRSSARFQNLYREIEGILSTLSQIFSVSALGSRC